jgi:hypothetical protein
MENYPGEWNPYDIYWANLIVVKSHLWMPYRLSKDMIGMVVKVDDDTAQRLYGRYYNWLTLHYLVKVESDPKDRSKRRATWERPGDYKAQIYSVDDASYGAWLLPRKLHEIDYMWHQIECFLMNKQDNWLEKGLNGQKFLDFCNDNFTATSFDYN